MADGMVRVLVVDDEEELTSALVERLRFRGFVCDGATSGAAALEMIEQRSYDVIVLDVKMPGLDGIEVITRLGTEHPDTRVILLTGHASAKVAEKGLDLGAVEYVLKPVKIDVLVEMIRKAAGIPTDGEGHS
jgi:DNA-binding response OmpR family regulator